MLFDEKRLKNLLVGVKESTSNNFGVQLIVLGDTNNHVV